MKRIFRRNQVIITTLAIMIAAAGYLNYSAKREVSGAEVYEAGMMEISDEDILAENQSLMELGDNDLLEVPSWDGDGEELMADGSEAGAGVQAGAGVDGQTNADLQANAGAGENADGSGAGAAATGETSAAGLDNPGEAVLTSGTSVSEYIAGVQLSREQMRAKNKETLMELINNDQIPEVEKQAAVQNMIRMTEVSEKENAAETLLKAKGFIDPVVSITEDQVDVVISASTITDPQRAQIEDIVKRKTEIGAGGIVITLLDLEE